MIVKEMLSIPPERLVPSASRAPCKAGCGCTDCYFRELGELVEVAPIGHAKGR